MMRCRARFETAGQRSRCMILLLVAPLTTGCSETVTPNPILLESLSGDAQEGEVGTILGSPLVVRVTDIENLPRGAMPVEWTVVQGGGELQPLDAMTDEAGIAEATWTLGADEGSQLAKATTGGESVTFRALARGS